MSFGAGERSTREKLGRARTGELTSRLSSPAARRSGPAPPPAADAAGSLRAALHARLLDELASENLLEADDDRIRTAV